MKEQWDNAEVINDLKNRLTRNQHRMEQALLVFQEVGNEFVRMLSVMERLASGADMQGIEQQLSLPIAVAVAHGIEVDKSQAQKLDLTKYDVIMDIPDECLRIKKKHERKITFDQYDLCLLGPKRVALLRYLLEHPNTTIGIHNIHEVPMYGEGLSRSGLAKAKGDLCTFLPRTEEGQSYIINTRALTAHRGIEVTTGYGYKINPCYRCLVIWKEF
jgi:hypothetical protein